MNNEAKGYIFWMHSARARVIEKMNNNSKKG